MRGERITWPCAIHGNEVHGELVGMDVENGRGLCLTPWGSLQRIPVAQIQERTVRTSLGGFKLVPVEGLPNNMVVVLSADGPPSFFSVGGSNA